MKASANCIKLIKRYEGFNERSYLCPAGIKTIGYGHVVKKNELFEEPISEEHASQILMSDLVGVENAVKRLITYDVNQNQFDALCSFTYNLGSGRLQSSTLRMKLNRGEVDEAAKCFSLYVFAGGKKLKGLVSRREDEYNLFQMKEDE